MPNAYFSPVIDTNWDTTGNWFDDPGFTTPLSTMSGLPEYGYDIYVYGQIDGYSSSAPPTLGNGYFDAGGYYGTFTNLSYTFLGSVIFNDGYFYGDGGTLNAATTVTFQNNSGIGGGSFSCTIYASTTYFNDTSGGYYGNAYYSAIYGTVIMNDDAEIYAFYAYNNVEIYDNAILGGQALFNTYVYNNLTIDSTATQVVSNVVVYDIAIFKYPASDALWDAMTSSAYDGLFYSLYPTMYFYYSITTTGWDDINSWYVDSGHTKKSYELPSSSTDVILDSNVSSNSGPTPGVNSLTINGNIYLDIALNAIGSITLNDTSQLGGSNPTIAAYAFIFNDSSYANNCTLDPYTPGSSSNATATFLDSSNNYSATINCDAIFGVSGGSDTAYNNATLNGTATFYANTYTSASSTVGGSATFYDSSYTTAGATIGASQILFYNNSTNNATLTGAISTHYFYNSSENAGASIDYASFNDSSHNNGGTIVYSVEYNDASYATSASNNDNSTMIITGDPISFTSTVTAGVTAYTFTRSVCAGGGGGGINGSSILGIL